MNTFHFVFLSFILLSLVSCDKNKTPEIVPKTPAFEGPGGYYFDGDSVSTPAKPMNFEVTRYLTKMDTTYSTDSVLVMIGSLTVSNPPAIRWSGTAGLPISLRYSSGWSQTYNKWAAVDQMKISSKNEINNELINCVLTFENGKTVERSTTVSIKHKNQINDLFRINFGMNRAQVKEQEESRKIGAFDWKEYSPDLVQSNSQGKVAESMQFQFASNQLIAVSEYNMDITSDKFNAIIKSMGSSVSFRRINGNIQPSLPQSWTKNGLKYTVQNKDIETANGKQSMEVLTYEKVL